tara:strand:- start:313 stop:495 length:183 start_codon:yes stop_codon:yes gene_type:complete
MSKKAPTAEMLKTPSMYGYSPDVVEREEIVLKPYELYLKSNKSVKFTKIKAALDAAVKPC